ncbi:MAG: cyclic nucleotide-binding domain-containing protein [Pseudolabrys sp.]
MHEPALFLAESTDELNESANFLSRLSLGGWRALRRAGTQVNMNVDATVFLQGDEHKGIWLIEAGMVRTFYAAPSGRQITLAYWPAGHFVGGPEIFGGGQHV